MRSSGKLVSDRCRRRRRCDRKMPPDDKREPGGERGTGHTRLCLSVSATCARARARGHICRADREPRRIDLCGAPRISGVSFWLLQARIKASVPALTRPICLLLSTSFLRLALRKFKIHQDNFISRDNSSLNYGHNFMYTSLAFVFIHTLVSENILLRVFF